MGCIKPQCCAIVWLALAVITLAGGVIFIFVEGDIESALTTFVDEKLMLTPENTDQLAYQLWTNPTGGANAVPIYMKFWFFNCTNAKEVAQNYAKPNLTVVGPYIYRESRWRTNMTWNANGTVISFAYHVNYTFARDLTNATLDPYNDTVWAPNAAMAALNTLPWFPGDIPPMVPGMNMTWQDAQVMQQILGGAIPLYLQNDSCPDCINNVWQFSPRHPNDIFGYVDPLMQWLHASMPTLPYNLSFIPNDNPLYWQNLSAIHTGKNNYNNVGQFTEWAGYKRVMPFWNSTEASVLNGTDGTTFAPGLDSEQVFIFIDQAGRDIVMNYNGTGNVKGLKTRHYIIDNNIYANSSVVPANAGYFQTQTPSGLMNVSSFISATGPGPSPVFISQPYFMGGDSDLSEAIILPRQPDPALDLAFIDIEPTTGQVLRAAKRLQVNILAFGDNYIGNLSNMFPMAYNGTSMYIPYFVGEEAMEITDALASQLKLELALVDTMHWVGIPISFTLFGIFALLSIVCWCKGQRRHEEERLLLAGDTQFGPNSQYTVSGKQVPPAYGVAPGKQYN